MTTSGSTDFNPDLTEIIEEAYEQAGKEVRSGYHFETGVRSLNQLLISWQNRGLNLWTVSEGNIPLTANQASYTIPDAVSDLAELIIRTNTGNAATAQDYVITRISFSDYSAYPNKQTTGRPVQVWIDRQTNGVKVVFWPAPDRDNFYAFHYWALRRIEDAGDGQHTPDVPFRFIPALTAGLAYKLAIKDPKLASRVPMLLQEYDRLYLEATSEDRVKTSFTWRPKVVHIGRA